jgi:plastocyanin
MKKILSLSLLSLSALCANAADVFTLTIENHTFSPKELTIPAGQKIRLQVINKDASPAEFESKPLGREKVIPGKSSATLSIGPLKAGRYSFVEEYHEDQPGAQGTIIAQ